MMCWKGTPSQTVSNLVQRVTQWMSVFTTRVGSSVNCCHESSSGASTSPKMRSRHFAGSNAGTPPTCSTGKSRTMYWPGGRRSARGSALAMQQLAQALDHALGIFRLRERAQHRNAPGTGGAHRADRVLVDAADREERNRAVRRSVADQPEPDCSAADLGRRFVDGPDTDVVHRQRLGGVDLFLRVGGQADDQIRADQLSHGVDRQIVLSEVDAVGTGGKRDVGPVVDDEERAQGPA